MLVIADDQSSPAGLFDVAVVPGGPPVIGFLRSISTIQQALGIVAAFIALSTLTVSSLEAPQASGCQFGQGE